MPNDKNTEQQADQLFFVNGREVGLNYVLQDGDVIVVTPRTIRAEAPMPRLRDFKRHLARSFGMVPVRGTGPRGRGDHQKWRHPNGWSIDVNPGHRNRAEVDLASVADLSRKLQVPFGQVYQKVMERI